MSYRFFIVDVFTEQAFGGNQLAILPAASGLSSTQMQRIAREFNFSETTFVLPPQDAGNTRQVRIFTPQHELPFAGHPNVGTAFALVASGEIIAPAQSIPTDSIMLRFEEIAGLVPVRVELNADQPRRAELTAPQTFSRGQELAPEQTAALFGLDTAELITRQHLPCLASAGADYLCVELRDLAALAHSKVVPDQIPNLPAAIRQAGFLLYTRDVSNTHDVSRNTPFEVDLRARMYAPTHGVGEDPATGGAACALAGLLGTLAPQQQGELHWRIGQGIEMSRPSLLQASVDKRDGQVTAIRVGGAAVMVAEGWIEAPAV
ncbi:MAG: PhzF family phenazine biosynthesis protein [Gammaproteobacteria bacterium]